MLTLDHTTLDVDTQPTLCGITTRRCPVAGLDDPICPQSGTTVCPSDTRKQETCPAC